MRLISILDLRARKKTQPRARYGSTTLSEDVNSDGIVDYTDVGLVANATFSVPGQPNWNPYADLNGDGEIGISDAMTVGVAYGLTGSPNWNPYADMNADNKIDAIDLHEIGKNYGKNA